MRLLWTFFIKIFKTLHILCAKALKIHGHIGHATINELYRENYVMAAILNNLEIKKKNAEDFHVWQQVDLQSAPSVLMKPSKMLYTCSMKKEKSRLKHLCVYDVMAAFWIICIFLKNAQGFTSGPQRIWNQHLHIDQKPSKNRLYMLLFFHTKNKVAVCVNSMGPILDYMYI